MEKAFCINVCLRGYKLNYFIKVAQEGRYILLWVWFYFGAHSRNYFNIFWSVEIHFTAIYHTGMVAFYVGHGSSDVYKINQYYFEKK